jgi:hypothetical protein
MLGNVKEKDLILILLKRNVLFVLRNKAYNKFKLVKHTYVHKAIDKEALHLLRMLSWTINKMFSNRILFI